MNSIDTATNQVVDRRLNNYILMHEIGHGGHGVVYKAYHENQPNEVVAIKVINDTGNLDMLLVEPEMLSRLQHPNIVSLRDYFLHAGKLVLVMEYIDGIDLKAYLEQHGPFTPPEIKTFLTQMANAMSHAHAHNIIHRDIKLSNILVTEDVQSQRYVLVDFGVSRMTEGIQTIKRIAGTYLYMAPEQIRGRPSEQSDLWALGVITYMLLTGTSPFEGDTKEDLSKKILYSIPDIPSAVIGETDSNLEKIIYHLLEKQLTDRMASAEDLLLELEKWSLPISQVPVPKSSDMVISRTFVPSWEEHNEKVAKRSWIFVWIFVFLVIIPDVIGGIMRIGGAMLFFLGQSPPGSKSRTFGGLGLVVVGLVVGVITWNFLWALVGALTGWSEASIAIASQIVPGILAIVQLPFVLIALHYFVKAKRLERNAFFLKALRLGSSEIEKLLGFLGGFVDVHLGDMNLHQKYAEMLLSVGRAKEAIVEAKRILEIDPYNFGATLLLAHGYFEVGLYRECESVCNGYLAISGYSFEFSDLIERCRKHLGGNDEV